MYIMSDSAIVTASIAEKYTTPKFLRVISQWTVSQSYADDYDADQKLVSKLILWLENVFLEQKK